MESIRPLAFVFALLLTSVTFCAVLSLLMLANPLLLLLFVSIGLYALLLFIDYLDNRLKSW
ncbi:hypothetical protein [Lyngbya confervoides]|uniref:Uncharacterized protein n=1 Tax=Lyngbya confervoides BDU141951 TaxID=1574623 RepID=A0ABD4T0L9_9CYAN|nr:hypothetical protein [Lyngbya confervoides]MCM1982173.1 hypothetical protein [Lyngbya confervoides BDU141951]